MVLVLGGMGFLEEEATEDSVVVAAGLALQTQVEAVVLVHTRGVVE